jgi:hypothetical protein
VRSVVYHVNYFAIFVLCATLLGLGTLAFLFAREPPLGRQIATVAADTARVAVSAGGAVYDPAAHSLTLTDVSVASPAAYGPGPAFTAGRIVLKIDAARMAQDAAETGGGRRFFLTSAAFEDVRVHLRVRPEGTNISALLDGLDGQASVKYHVMPGRLPLTLQARDVIAPRVIGLVDDSGRIQPVPSGPLRELGMFGREMPALLSEEIAAALRAFGRAALGEAARRGLLQELGPEGVAQVSRSFDAREQGENRIRDLSRQMAKRFKYIFDNL